MSYELYTDYDSANNALPILYNDGAIGTGTRILLDALDPNCYPGLALPVSGLPAGAALNNLVNDLPEITVGSVAFPALGAAGLKFGGASAQTIKLPSRVKLDMSIVTHFGVSMWLKPAAMTATGSNWDSPASHILNGTPAGTAWVIQRNAIDPTKYHFKMAGSTAIFSIAQDELAWVFMDAYIDNAAKTSRIDLYKNGVLVVPGVAVALPSGWNPAITTDALIGGNPAFAARWAGQVSRFSIDDFTAPFAKSVAKFLEDEAAQCVGRFS